MIRLCINITCIVSRVLFVITCYLTCVDVFFLSDHEVS